MRNTQLIILLFLSVSISGQKYYTQTGETSFTASVGSFEPIEATNKSTSALLDPESGSLACLVFIKAFTFRVSLMQEHFNENYMSSNTFPRATFRGLVKGFDLSQVSQGSQYTILGTLSIKGIEKEIETLGTFSTGDSGLSMWCSFGVSPEDFGIEIPKIVRNKISKTVNVTLRYEFVEKK